MDQPAIAIPECCPLGTRGHLVIGEDRTHVRDRVLEHRLCCEFIEIGTVARKLQRAEYRSRIGCHFTLEQGFNGKGDERRRRNGRCIRNRGGIGNGWGKGDRW